MALMLATSVGESVGELDGICVGSSLGPPDGDDVALIIVGNCVGGLVKTCTVGE